MHDARYSAGRRSRHLNALIWLLCQDTTSSARPRLLPGEPFQRGPIAHGPTMTKWIGKASLTMQPPRRIVLSCRFHIGRASLCSPFYEVIGHIDEDFDPGRRQAHVRRARLLTLTRHSFVEKEWRAFEVKPGNAAKIPQQPGAEPLRIPADRGGSVGHDQHDREGWARSRVAHSQSLCHRFRRLPVRTWPVSLTVLRPSAASSTPASPATTWSASPRTTPTSWE
jgi:hypothetical protein